MMKTKAQVGVTVMFVLVVVLLVVGALGCVKSQARNNPFDPAVVTPTPE